MLETLETYGANQLSGFDSKQIANYIRLMEASTLDVDFVGHNGRYNEYDVSILSDELDESDEVESYLYYEYTNMFGAPMMFEYYSSMFDGDSIITYGNCTRGSNTAWFTNGEMYRHGYYGTNHAWSCIHDLERLNDSSMGIGYWDLLHVKFEESDFGDLSTGFNVLPYADHASGCSNSWIEILTNRAGIVISSAKLWKIDHTNRYGASFIVCIIANEDVTGDEIIDELLERHIYVPYRFAGKSEHVMARIYGCDDDDHEIARA